MSDYLPLPKKTDRITGQKYTYKDNIVIWDGKRILCEHNKRKENCIKCGGASMCKHDKVRSVCKECGGGSMCEHGRRRSTCKECGGGAMCTHGIRRTRCIECGGGSMCEHKRVRSRCVECGGGETCEHNKIKSFCKECGGNQICDHGIPRTRCVECRGGSICDHDRVRSRCIECRGSSFCNHDIRKDRCKICNPNGHLSHTIRERVRGALRNYSTRKDKKHTFEYVGSLEDVRIHLENQFENESERCGHLISWENQGEWHIDHIRPCASFNLDLEEERHKCFHYTNLQPLWGTDNMSKNDTYNEDEDEREWDGDKWN